MSMVKCPKCEKEYSEELQSCPFCGNGGEETQGGKYKEGEKYIGTAVILLCGLSIALIVIAAYFKLSSRIALSRKWESTDSHWEATDDYNYLGGYRTTVDDETAVGKWSLAMDGKLVRGWDKYISYSSDGKKEEESVNLYRTHLRSSKAIDTEGVDYWYIVGTTLYCNGVYEPKYMIFWYWDRWILPIVFSVVAVYLFINASRIKKGEKPSLLIETFLKKLVKRR